MNKFRQIEAFVSAAEKGSLSRAALEEGVTPAILGRRIDALEKRLGVKLMHRSTRRLALTESGAAFLERCKKLLEDMEQAEKSVSEERSRATGHLIVSAPASFGRKHVAAHAPDFLKANPDVRISFNLSDQVVDLVREGYDMSIRIGGTIDPSLVAVRLFPNHRVVCGTPAYLEKHGVPQTLKDLARHNCLTFNLQGGQQRGWYFRENNKTVTIRTTGNLDCNDGELLHRWCLEGLGLAWRSTWEIQSQLASGELVTVLDKFALSNYDIMAIYPQQSFLPLKTRFFIDYLRTLYAQPGYWTQSA
ncbi:LysR family transcriptional regulator [Oxalobacter sp. OttesenSCG-928-P03]|nr:LysR family transcriptional regulator [Oxalobacter sp. OttesenSCG-928-P03]